MSADARPEGLAYKPGFVSAEEEREALAVVEALEFQEVRMRGQVARRTVAHFGLDYDYEHGKLAPGKRFPVELNWLRDRCASFAGVRPEELAQVLVSRYPPGAGIGWHRDAPMFGQVAGVSLGSTCRMRFQRGKGEDRRTFAVDLEPRSAYLLAGAARWAWQHSIPATRELRYSVTFRTLKSS